MTPLSTMDSTPLTVHDHCAVLVIPPEKHPIREEMIDKDALYILKKLNSEGFSGYLVGGGVRDLYLGKKPKDFDISTDARPGQLRKIFPHSNTIGRRFRLVQVFFRGGKTIEVSTLRSLSEHDIDGPEGILAPNNTFGTLSEDARRRDLTINSLFYEIEKNTIIDYVNGSSDLDKAIIRMVGEPEKRIHRDPVRMMRAIRHSARNSFTIEEKTRTAIVANTEKLTLCPPSRLRDEFFKDLYSGASAPWYDLALDTGIYTTLFPLYKKNLNKEVTPGLSTREMLHNIFKTIDRTNKVCQELGIHRQRDYFLLALTLIPWAESRYQLISVHRKGGPLFNLAKQVRDEINHSIGINLNLRRSLRQEVVSLLINLSHLLHTRKKNSWPKWLRKKSYFKSTHLFYRFFLEAAKGTPVTPEALGACSANSQKLKDNRKDPSQKHHYKPAFAKKTKGGIFGFKK